MSVSNEDLQFLLNLGLTEEEALAVLGAPPINSEAVASSVSSGLEIQPQIPTIEDNISDQIIATGNNVEAEEAQARLNDYGMNSVDATVKADANPVQLTEQQSIQVTQDILNSNPEVKEYFGSNANATLDSILPDVVTPPPGSIDVSTMPSQDDIFGTDYGDGATMSTSPTTGGLGDFSDNVTTPIEEQYGEQVTFDTSGNMIPPGQGPQSGVPGIPVSSLPGIAELEGVQYRPRKTVGFREIPNITPPGNDIGSPPQNTVPTPPVQPDVGVPEIAEPPPVYDTVVSQPQQGATQGYQSGVQNNNVMYRAKGGLILKDPMPGYKGRGV
jgi:hypothetical protein